ncbi:hypothetical protein PMNALOAF_0401 [Methylobacterium adhaesivum]|jgi:hypothetical protein|uniref:Glycine zipper domain-containing protein n=1 Tax=Methylobacterium adhaesivum TaxID=333297 RepID=A0ABT8BDP0_9HYPH|nr:hypothetical protein [Methylobacterium adhaesivum]MDN3590101.1 hypothetical protein [Methylobacterium adhaesivum]GJD29169.1 hypothetical protein PMNALOAF_0401 [Methylobacterium adhaesivum]
MKNLALSALLLGVLAMPVTAQAASNTVVGVGTGAVAGAVVGGPIGAVVGAVVGGVVGSNSERARPRRARRTRAVRARRQAAQARPVNVAERGEEARRTIPAAATTGSVTAPRPPAVTQPATTWQNPR